MRLPGVVAADGRSFVPAHEPPVVVDLRPPEQFILRHIAGSCSLPLSELQPRLFELPPPGEWQLTLVGSRAQLATARELICPKGWEAEEWNAEDSALWSSKRTERGPSALRSWRPNSFLYAVLKAATLQQAQSSGLAVDLGCGSGRDAVYIAQQLQHRTNWSVGGIDNHKSALQRGGDLAASAGVHVHFEAANLRRGGLQSYLASSPLPLRLVHGCRFLDAPLLEQLPSLIAPGGIIVWSTFLEGCEALAPPYRASRRLVRGQLRAQLGEGSGFRVLHDSEGELLTRGRWVPAQFYAAQRERAATAQFCQS